MASTSIGFVKADSTNLPKVNMFDILEHMRNSDKFNIAEIRGAKALMSSRDSYIDSAVGYVEVKRTASQECYIRAKITPEHNIRKKLYVVTVHINENTESIIDSTCEDCAASAGGCKHSLLLLFWLEKQNSKPSSTSVTCYWRKPCLSSAVDDVVESKEVYPSTSSASLPPKNTEILENFKQKCKEHQCVSSLVYVHLKEPDITSKNGFSVFQLLLVFSTQEHIHTYERFKTFCHKVLTDSVIHDLEISTQSQSASKLWHSIRQGRITGSKIYEIAHCKTANGSLVEQILGGYKVPENKAMKRGKKIEKLVLRKVEEILNVKIENAGFILLDGIVGASPDGITEGFVVEIKCPMTKNTMLQYIRNGVVNQKYYAQIQLQMLVTKKLKGVFCVADPEFERNKEVNLVWVDFDFIMKTLSEAEMFWKDNVFPKILNSVIS